MASKETLASLELLNQTPLPFLDIARQKLKIGDDPAPMKWKMKENIVLKGIR